MTEVRVSALYTYPIKSCAGIQHEWVDIDVRGPRNDREWMVVDESGLFITQREVPRMAVIKPVSDVKGLTVNAASMSTLRVSNAHDDSIIRQTRIWKDTCEAIDAGDEAAAWFSEYLGVASRLVRITHDFKRSTSIEYTEMAGEVSFADGYPLLFISKGSLADLNERLVTRGKSPVPVNRFRPNVVVSGCDPYAEDLWQEISIGGITFDVVKPCARCAITTVDQSVGEAPDAREALATLATYRRGAGGGVIFGQNVIHRGRGTIRVGDVVRVS